MAALNKADIRRLFELLNMELHISIFWNFR